ncbi:MULTISPECIES: outer membrane protein [Bosea]|jgi:outer membrane immunogenic protein|uniref:outer membrane protein n=1 Tax=Bosea TaxID=85413 RepID=UPI00214FCCE7|nr:MULTISPECIES: outer membrane protein [Bosea]MCR4520168.1 porin family protein [Bosea sp. 47.2.35]MDR6829734.1 outer membrane immunogenic protein [Bosea robiniae]MDR6896617.1 outer membrane immunogenic protein [Bosea sp. BE109]MDR7140015.1 outer membrane immunogenic protein [Bosea sp. BE168]MDR7176671.1 outer membrane immunogenic protein [Bosea sp. BE271]
MKKYLLASVAALGLVAAGAASAADLPSRKGPVVAPVYVPAFTWTGFYVGANAGYGWGNVNANGFANVGDLDGFVGGGQVGYNYQMGQFVVGLEADLQAADLSSGNNLGLINVKTDYFGTVRARVGVAFDRFMPYITGGWAYGNVKTSIPGIGFSSDRSHTGGYAVGAGLEYAVTNNIIAGVEYLYVDLGEKNILGANTKIGTDFSVVRARLSYKF